MNRFNQNIRNWFSWRCSVVVIAGSGRGRFKHRNCVMDICSRFAINKFQIDFPCGCGQVQIQYIIGRGAIRLQILALSFRPVEGIFIYLRNVDAHQLTHHNDDHFTTNSNLIPLCPHPGCNYFPNKYSFSERRSASCERVAESVSSNDGDRGHHGVWLCLPNNEVNAAKRGWRSKVDCSNCFALQSFALFQTLSYPLRPWYFLLIRACGGWLIRWFEQIKSRKISFYSLINFIDLFLFELEWDHFNCVGRNALRMQHKGVWAQRGV